MKQIIEAYVSYEVAKLLKEKGFKENVQSLWIGEDEYHYISSVGIKLDNYNSCGTDLYSAPTHQMAMAWLREEKNVFIRIDYVHLKDGLYEYSYTISNMKIGRSVAISPFRENYPSYEEAVEAALKYSLENLVK